jgi:hypothetical protein
MSIAGQDQYALRELCKNPTNEMVGAQTKGTVPNERKRASDSQRGGPYETRLVRKPICWD